VMEAANATPSTWPPILPPRDLARVMRVCSQSQTAWCRKIK
jgi:hypothetical protein